MTVNITAMKADTDNILADWGEDLVAWRRSPVYGDDGMPSNNWQEIGTCSGDFQPVDGQTMRAEAGMKIQSDAKVFVKFDKDIRAGDKVVREDNSFMYVNYIRAQPEHKVVYLTKTEVE